MCNRNEQRVLGGGKKEKTGLELSGFVDTHLIREGERGGESFLHVRSRLPVHLFCLMP